MKRPVLLGVIFLLAVLGVIVYSSMNMSTNRVEACITFKGQLVCRTASGASEEFALRTAISNACAGLASGVTETMACEGAPPTRVTKLK